MLSLPLAAALLIIPVAAAGQNDPAAKGKDLYDRLKPFTLTGIMPIKEDFILAELDNSLRFCTTMFGRYPYSSFSAAFHPFSFGQGFPTLLMIPPTDQANKNTYVFIAHETAHQWWGDIVSWRSYRDQWLDHAFAGGDLNQEAHGTVLAHGPKAPFQIRLPGKPQKVELDPHHWVLSDKTSTK